MFSVEYDAQGDSSGKTMNAVQCDYIGAIWQGVMGVSSDGGKSWHSLVADYPDTSVTFDIDKTLFDPSDSFLIRVRAMDGFLSTDAIMEVSFEMNPECVDTDGDDVCDDTDNCINEPNPLQLNFEDDGLGDVCDPDDDNDGVVGEEDWCPFSALLGGW